MADTTPIEFTLDERAQPVGSCRRLTNFKLTPDKYWSSEIGWEPLKRYPDENTHNYIDIDYEPVRFLGVFRRHEGAETYYLHEKDGYLLYEYGNGDGVVGADKTFLYFNRHVPNPTELGSQLISAGNVAVICNGVDAPLKFWGKERITEFGYRTRPPSLSAYAIQPSFITTGEFTSSEPATATSLDDGSFFGLTTLDKGDWSYGYKVSFVSDTGSESPLSDEATLTITVEENAERGRFIAFLRLPVGPPGTVARRIYRTHNRQFADAGTGDYYFIKQIDNNSAADTTDYYPDSMLVDFAPGYGDRINELITVVKNFGNGCMYDGRLWVSGGEYGSSLAYSDRSSASPPKNIETFSIFNTIELGDSGEVCHIQPLGRQLIVFRVNSIDVVTRQLDDTYAFSNLTTSTGTTAGNSVQIVPGLGMVFLTPDGFYLITLDTNGNPLINPISQPQERTLRRMNVTALPRATSCYNAIQREYWCHLPIDGDIENTLGVVLHTGSDLKWTYRRAPEGANTRTMAVSCLGYDDRNTIMGMVPWDSSVADGAAGNPLTGTWHSLGLQVFSAAPAWGFSYSGGSGGQEAVNYETITVSTPLGWELETNWLTFGTKKSTVQYLDLYCLSTGYQQVTLQAQINERSGFRPIGNSYLLNSEDTTNHSDDFYRPVSKHGGTWGTTRVNPYRRIHLRWPINLGECDSIKFRLTGTSLVGLVSMSMELEATNTKGLPRIKA